MKSRFTVALVACAATLLLSSVTSAERRALSRQLLHHRQKVNHIRSIPSRSLFFHLSRFLASDAEVYKPAHRRNDYERLN